MADIQNGLAAGKEVTVHQAPITQSGWTGSGYIITDPETGAGAYKIAGGANGGVLIAQSGIALLGIIKIVQILNIIGPILGIAFVSNPVGLAVMLLVATITTIAAYASDNPFASSTISSQLITIVALLNLGAIAAVAFPLLALIIYYLLLELVIDILTAANQIELEESFFQKKAMV